MHRWFLIFLIMPAIAFGQIADDPPTGIGGADADSLKGVPLEDTTGSLFDNYMMRFNLGTNQWEYEVVPGASGGSADSLTINDGSTEFHIMSNYLKIKEGTGLDITREDSTAYDVMRFTVILGVNIEDAEVDNNITVDPINATTETAIETAIDYLNLDTLFVGSPALQDGDGDTAIVNISTAVPGRFLTGESDAHFGDSTSGMIGLGMGRIGMHSDTTYNSGKINMDRTMWFKNNGNPPGNFEFLFVESTTNNIRFGIPKSGAGLGTWNPRSLFCAGPMVYHDSAAIGTFWGFDSLAMATDVDGADFGVQNDVQILGELFIDSIRSAGQTELNINQDVRFQGNIAMTGTMAGADVISADSIIIGEDTLYNEHLIAYLTRLRVRNASGATLTAGTPVYISGITGNRPNVDSARADNAALMPAVGLIEHDISSSADGFIVISGEFGPYNTLAWSVQDPLYVDATGGLTSTKPTGTNLIQKMGIVTRDNAAVGTIQLVGAGRTNDLPNIASANFWIGDASAVPMAVTMSGDAIMDNTGAITIGTDVINDTHIDWGIGANQVSIIDVPAENWRVLYSNGTGVITELALGAAGEVLKSNGASSAPTWQTDATGGSPVLVDIFAFNSRAYFDTTTGVSPDSMIVIFADSSDIAIFDTDDLTEGASNLYNQTHTGDVTGAVTLTIGVDKVNDTHIDWGTGANQVSIIDIPAENWNVLYSNGSGVITELALGAAGEVLKSNGASSAPSWQTDATGGSPALEDIFAFNSRDYFDTTTGISPDSMIVIFADSSDISIFDTDDLIEGASNLYNQTHTGDVTGAVALTIGTDKINETHIDWGTGANQVSIIDVPAENWRVLYSNGTGVITELALGAAGEVLKSNGPSSAPTWQTDATGGSPALEDIFAFNSRDYFDTTTGISPDSMIVIFADSSDISIFDTDDLTEGISNLYNQTHTGDVTGAVALTIGTDKINETHIDWGTGANQVSIIDVPAENWRVLYSNGTGVITELALGSDNTFLQSNGASSAPTFETVDSTHITDGDLSVDDINWRYEYIYLEMVHGWGRALDDSSYLNLPIHNGSSSYLLTVYAGDITPTHSDTFFVSGFVPFGCSVDTLIYMMKEAGSGGVNDIDFYTSDISDGTMLTDSLHYSNATARTPGTTWTIYNEDITDYAATPGERFGLRFIIDFAADNDSTWIGWVKLAVRR